VHRYQYSTECPECSKPMNQRNRLTFRSGCVHMHTAPLRVKGQLMLLLFLYVHSTLSADEAKAAEAAAGIDSLREGITFARKSWSFVRDFFACETATVFMRTVASEFVLVDMPACSTVRWNEAIRALVAPREALKVWLLRCELGACERVSAIKDPTTARQATVFLEIVTAPGSDPAASVPSLKGTFSLSAVDRFAFTKANLMSLLRGWSFVSVEPEESYEPVGPADPLNHVVRRAVPKSPPHSHYTTHTCTLPRPPLLPTSPVNLAHARGGRAHAQHTSTISSCG
jgi:hypothetical protein